MFSILMIRRNFLMRQNTLELIDLNSKSIAIIFDFFVISRYSRFAYNVVAKQNETNKFV